MKVENENDDYRDCSNCIHSVSTEYGDQYFYFCKKLEVLVLCEGMMIFCNEEEWEARP